jgi:hypothetical protein
MQTKVNIQTHCTHVQFYHGSTPDLKKLTQIELDLDEETTIGTTLMQTPYLDKVIMYASVFGFVCVCVWGC